MLGFLAAVGVLWHLSVSAAEKLKIVNLCFIMKKNVSNEPIVSSLQ